MTLQLAFTLRERGIADASTGLNAVAVARIADAIRYVSERLATFTVEDVTREISVEVRDQIATRPAALGAAFHNAAVAGVIEQTGVYVRSQKPNGRARRIAVWRRKVAP